MNNEISLIPTKEELDIIQVMAKTAAESKYFDRMGGVAAIFSIALNAREMGIPVMTALHGGLVVVMGKVTMSAEMMNNLIRQKGHRLEILEASSSVCRIKGTRKDTGESYSCSFSMEDAKKAGLNKSGGGYDKHTDDMLFARCISKLKRRLFPDVATKAYVEGELDGEIEDEVKPQKPQKIEEMEVSKPQEPSDYEYMAQFKDKFLSFENSENTLDDFVELTSKKGKINPVEVMKHAVKSPERFTRSYQKWVTEMTPTIEVKEEKPTQETLELT